MGKKGEVGSVTNGYKMLWGKAARRPAERSLSAPAEGVQVPISFRVNEVMERWCLCPKPRLEPEARETQGFSLCSRRGVCGTRRGAPGVLC